MILSKKMNNNAGNTDLDLSIVFMEYKLTTILADYIHFLTVSATAEDPHDGKSANILGRIGPISIMGSG